MKILLIVQPERFDFYNYLAKDISNEYILLWYEEKSQMKLQLTELPIQFSSVIYWTQFVTPSDLLNSVRPDKIIFFEIIDLRQIALIVTAKRYKTTTFYLEHGAAGSKETAIIRWNETTFVKNKGPYLISRLINHLPLILKSKIFYYAVFRGFSTFKAYLYYLWLPFAMLRALPNKVLTKYIFKERVPDYSIVFNEINFEEHFLYTGAQKQNALLTGVPFFDSYYNAETVIKNHWVYIDHPYYENDLIGWTKDHHKKIATELFKYAAEHSQEIFVKLHPRSNPKLWEGYDNPGDYVKIIQFGDYTKLYLESKLILAFSSSLVTGLLCAKKNIVLLGWHPQPFVFGMDFSKTGLCHLSLEIDELRQKASAWVSNNLCVNKEENYNSYIKDLNYPFDGQATERVIKAINTL